MAIMLDPEVRDFPVQRLGHLPLCPFDFGTFFWGSAMMLNAPHVNMQAIGFRSDA